jgi:hypothetical protein
MTGPHSPESRSDLTQHADAAGCNGSDIGIFASAWRAAKYGRYEAVRRAFITRTPAIFGRRGLMAPATQPSLQTTFGW